MLLRLLCVMVCGFFHVSTSLPPFVWGTMSFAEGKGYTRQFGLAGILGLVGLVCLMLLPD